MVRRVLNGYTSNNDTSAISKLASPKTYVNEKDYVGLTPLHIASGEGSAETVGLLCRLGADVNAVIDFEESQLNIWQLWRAIMSGFITGS